jgi:hypothetical protein
MRFIKVLVTPLAGSVVVPGSGSLFLLFLLGGAAGLALAGKLYWHRFLTAIGVRSRKAGEASADGDVPAPATSRTDN